MKCPKCGKNNQKSAAYCISCGTLLEDDRLETEDELASEELNEWMQRAESALDQVEDIPEESEEEPSAYADPTPYVSDETKKQQKLNRLKLIAAVIVIFALLVTILPKGGSTKISSYEDLVYEYFDSLYDLSARKVYNCYNDRVVSALRDAYAGIPSTSEGFLMAFDSLYFDASRSTAGIPDFTVSSVSDYTSQAQSMFDEINYYAGTSFNVTKAYVLEITPDRSTVASYYFDSVYYMTLIRLNNSWYVFSVE